MLWQLRGVLAPVPRELLEDAVRAGEVVAGHWPSTPNPSAIPHHLRANPQFPESDPPTPPTDPRFHWQRPSRNRPHRSENPNADATPSSTETPALRQELWQVGLFGARRYGPLPPGVSGPRNRAP
jgi:hypothetical protein